LKIEPPETPEPARRQQLARISDNAQRVGRMDQDVPADDGVEEPVTCSADAPLTPRNGLIAGTNWIAKNADAITSQRECPPHLQGCIIRCAH
jgi:hypothetical protein